MTNDFDYFEYYFIETEDELYYLAEVPNMIYNHSFNDYLSNNEEVLLINKSEGTIENYVKAYRMATKQIISCGYGQSTRTFSQDKLEEIRQCGKFNGQPLYRMV